MTYLDGVADTRRLRQVNRSAVLRALYQEPHSVTDLVHRLGLSRTTAEGALQYLDVLGLIERTEVSTPDRGGRPPARYLFRRRCGHALGVEVAADTARAVLVDVGPRDGMFPGYDAPAPWEAQVSTSFTAGPAERLAALDRAVDSVLHAAGIRPSHIDSVTAATPGVVAPDGSVVVCGVLDDWKGRGLIDHLRRTFGDTTIDVDNDANLAALAEAHVGGRIADDLVLVFTGPRIGIGIVLGGQVRPGAGGRAGESANVRRSSWQRASAWLGEHVDALPELLTGSGSASAGAKITELYDLLAAGTADVVHLLDPSVIVIGGRLAEPDAAVVVASIRDRVADACRPERAAPPIEASRLGDHAVVAGAVHRAVVRARDAIVEGLPDRSRYLGASA